MPEYKSSPEYVKTINGRQVTGVFAVHGNIDGGLDCSHPGAFAKTFNEGMRRIKYLWMHNPYDPPTAVIKALRELTREELPAQVLAAAPDATGGAEVTREYLATERGNEILAGIVAGAISELSYGYDPVKWDMSQDADGKTIRNLREIKVWDISDVVWGLNPATTASKFNMPAELLFQQLQAFAAELKAGNRNNASDQERIDMMHALSVDLGARNCKGVIEDTEDGKSRAGLATHSEPIDVSQLFLDFQRTVARLQGVAI